MEAFVVIALIGFGLLAAELLLPTGGVLALFGIAGLVVGGILALGSSDTMAAAFATVLIGLFLLIAAALTWLQQTRGTWVPGRS